MRSHIPEVVRIRRSGVSQWKIKHISLAGR
jgi:hypothetical protein